MTRTARIRRAFKEYHEAVSALDNLMEAKLIQHQATCPRCFCGKEADAFTGLCIVHEMAAATK